MRKLALVLSLAPVSVLASPLLARAFGWDEVVWWFVILWTRYGFS